MTRPFKKIRQGRRVWKSIKDQIYDYKFGRSTAFGKWLKEQINTGRVTAYRNKYRPIVTDYEALYKRTMPTLNRFRKWSTPVLDGISLAVPSFLAKATVGAWKKRKSIRLNTKYPRVYARVNNPRLLPGSFRPQFRTWRIRKYSRKPRNYYTRLRRWVVRKPNKRKFKTKVNKFKKNKKRRTL